MKKSLCLIVGIVSLLGSSFVMAADKPTTAPTTRPADAKVDASKPAINKFCAVEGGDKAVDSEFFVIYKGMKIGFCCGDCMKDFNEDPEKYVAALKARKDGLK